MLHSIHAHGCQQGCLNIAYIQVYRSMVLLILQGLRNGSAVVHRGTQRHAEAYRGTGGTEVCCSAGRRVSRPRRESQQPRRGAVASAGVVSYMVPPDIMG